MHSLRRTFPCTPAATTPSPSHLSFFLFRVPRLRLLRRLLPDLVPRVRLPRLPRFLRPPPPPPKPGMLLLHQVGSVKIGDTVRYTVSYTPAHDRILPGAEHLWLRIRNTSSSALRAAFVHGPYTLYVDAAPAHFDPNRKLAHPRRYGVPEFEPMLKAGGSWTVRLVVPDTIRGGAGRGDHDGDGHGHGHGADQPSPSDPPSATWVINVCSQVIFSTSAAVHYEVLVARDPQSLDSAGSGGGGLALPLLGGGGGSGGGGGGGGGDQGDNNNTNSKHHTRGKHQALQPGRVSDYQRGRDGRHPDQPKGVFSRAVRLRVEDTAALWNKPQLPGWNPPSVGAGGKPVGAGESATESPSESAPPRKQKKIHLVVLTHGLHSNLGGDMLYIKESIDAAVRQARVDRRARRAREREAAGKARDDEDDDDDDDDEEVLVRGYAGNATRTERGIKYLGKRLARYVLSTTYPDQPFLPSGKAGGDRTAPEAGDGGIPGIPAHKHSSVQVPGGAADPAAEAAQRPYRYTKISFVAHSLGGLVQTYAVAYIQKHSPDFFARIEPVNFIAMASPFLGLNHENPLYVKFALDFGLVGRTGQDLGLTWRAPTLARSGWGALVGNLGDTAQKKVLGAPQPESKPLLRILPTGPAHTALKRFRNRTVYSNVVNDGIVPLRTSCLLFLDWQGLGRVEKARREAGLVETVVGFGWAELVGANVTAARRAEWGAAGDEDENENENENEGEGDPAAAVPQPPTNATQEDGRASLQLAGANPFREDAGAGAGAGSGDNAAHLSTATTNNANPITNFFSNLFKSDGDAASSSAAAATAAETPPHAAPAHPAPHGHGGKQNKIYQRSQTLRSDSAAWSTTASGSGSGSGPAAVPPLPGQAGEGAALPSSSTSTSKTTAGDKPRAVATSAAEPDAGATPGEVSAPPRTTFFESATDIINPKLPTVEFLIDPAKRPRTIFHDRVYHPSDIPPPPRKKAATAGAAGMAGMGEDDARLPRARLSFSRARSPPTKDASAAADDDELPVDSASIKVEEKIARAYHRGMAWRKVLVKLEPDAHNNMVVRRTFANAFGWPVVQHMVDAHFSDAAAARRRDADEAGGERARPLGEGPDRHGRETVDGGDNSPTREAAEAADDDASTDDTTEDGGDGGDGDDTRPDTAAPSDGPQESVTWSEQDWADSGDDDSEAASARSARSGRPGQTGQTGRPAGAKPKPKPPTGVSVTATGGTTTGPLMTLPVLRASPLGGQPSKEGQEE